MSGKESNMKYLLDTNMIIYYLNGDKKAIDFIDTNLKNSAISSITYLEILVFSYDEEEDQQVRDFLELFKIYDVEREILDIAINTYRKKKVKMADNLIGSTAKLYDLILVTRNIDDFKNMELDILNIYE
jgi:predicted nucleic acid-binding protein